MFEILIFYFYPCHQSNLRLQYLKPWSGSQSPVPWDTARDAGARGGVTMQVYLTGCDVVTLFFFFPFHYMFFLLIVEHHAHNLRSPSYALHPVP